MLTRLLRPSEQRATLKNPDGELINLLRNAGGSMAAGVAVTPDNALEYSAVLGGVRVLAEGVAQLPLIVYERLARGRRRADEHPLYDLLHLQPNPYQTSFEWREVLMIHALMRGDAFAEVEWSDGGQVRALWPLLPQYMTIYRAPDRTIWYEYQQPGVADRVFQAYQMLHVPCLAYNGLRGRGILAMATPTIGLGKAAEQYGSAFFSNGARPSVALEYPGVLSDQAFNRLRKKWEQDHSGLENAQRVAILEEGMKLTSYGTAPEDAQFLETRKFQRNEVAAVLRLSPSMLGDSEAQSYASMEQEMLRHVQLALMPWYVRIEQRLSTSLMTAEERRRYYVEFLVDGLLRGDMKTRHEVYATGRQWGYYSANDVRIMDNQDVIEGGDEYLVPMNMIPASQLGQQTPAQPQPGADAQGNGQRTAVTRTARLERELRQSVGGRQRLIAVHQPLLQDAAQRIINRETNDILNAARRMLGTRSAGAGEKRSISEFSEWLQTFMFEHKQFVRERLWPGVWTFAQLIADAAIEEAAEAGYRSDAPTWMLRAVDAGKTSERFTAAMLQARAEQWGDRLRIGLENVMAGAMATGDDPAAAVENYLKDRRENDAAGWARDAGVAFGNAVAVAVWTVIGVMALRWLAFGESCPYCEALNGRVVGIAEFFVNAADGIAPEGHMPLKSGNVRHSPLHGGCDCMVAPG